MGLKHDEKPTSLHDSFSKWTPPPSRNHETLFQAELNEIILPQFEILQATLKRRFPGVQSDLCILNWLCVRLKLTPPAWWPSQAKHLLPKILSGASHRVKAPVATEDIEMMRTQTGGSCAAIIPVSPTDKDKRRSVSQMARTPRNIEKCASVYREKQKTLNFDNFDAFGEFDEPAPESMGLRASPSPTSFFRAGSAEPEPYSEPGLSRPGSVADSRYMAANSCRASPDRPHRYSPLPEVEFPRTPAQQQIPAHWTLGTMQQSSSSSARPEQAATAKPALATNAWQPAPPCEDRPASGSRPVPGQRNLPVPSIQYEVQPLSEELPSPQSVPQAGLRLLDSINQSLLRDATRHEGTVVFLKQHEDSLQDSVLSVRLKFHKPLVNAIPLLSLDLLTAQEQYAVIQRLQRQKFRNGDIVCKQGDMGTSLYIVESGACDVIRMVDGSELMVEQLIRGGSFGVVSVFRDRPREASLRARCEEGEEVTLLRITSIELQEALGGKKVEELRTFVRVTYFSELPGFRTLATKQLALLVAHLEQRTFSKGQIIAHAGEQLKQMHIVEQGEAFMEVPEGGLADRRKHDMNASSGQILVGGQQVGMLSLFMGAPLALTLRARTETVQMLTLQQDALKAIDGLQEGPVYNKLRRSLQEYLVLHWDPLQKLTADQLARVLDRSFKVRAQRWQPIVNKDSVQDAVYFLEEGSVIMTNGDEALPTGGSNSPDEPDLGGSGTRCTRPGTHFGTAYWMDPVAKADFSLVANAEKVLMLKVPKSVLREVMPRQAVLKKRWVEDGLLALKMILEDRGLPEEKVILDAQTGNLWVSMCRVAHIAGLGEARRLEIDEGAVARLQLQCTAAELRVAVDVLLRD
eukprot:TRINITY_DN52416_c0_g1_i1.p1 TRINITY_DN52416_c0_g1~~TRINITY_DN52416_c0_g1_i1.p1  ORF type:complete len:860 (-),score=230.53 TRINITY_DN52416_c0_g1_i1:117-2696(-)